MENNDGHVSQMFKVVMWGVIAAVFLGIKIIALKWLIIKGEANADTTGIFMMFIDAVLGTICLIITSIQGSGIYDMSPKGFGMIWLAGLTAYIYFLLSNYAFEFGLAGVAISIINTSAAIHVILCSIFLK